jgi:tetratricopeptide (TPR) repeat protein
MRFFISLICIILLSTPTWAQGTSDEQLAVYYLEQGDFEKAKLYYEKLYKSNPSSTNYNGLYQALNELNEFKEAEKLIKQQMKRFNSNIYYIDLGALYERMQDQKSADKSYAEAIDNLPKSQGMVIRTANEFIKRNKLELALETYQKGKQLLENSYPFNYEIASLYGSMGDKQRMIVEYLDLITYNNAYLQTVQNSLNRSIDLNEENADTELLRNELLRRVQKNPQETIFAEMLTWLFLQRRDFNAAFVQLKAIDKRLNEDGQRVLNLAGLAMNNSTYDVASKCYQYVADKGSSNPYYTYARAGQLRADFEQLRITYPPDNVALKTLQSQYIEALASLGKNTETVALLRQKAILEARYLGDLLAANITLNEALEIPGLTPLVTAEIKLELAEILVARDFIWDASLLASQVDKDFKQDVIGFEAKLLNARISYYVGDFEWAQAQLDVLKGGTTKLIANNAMRLSLLITDNLNLDTILDPMLKYARADLMILQRQFGAAEATLDSISELYPYHALGDEILIQKAAIKEATGNLDAALGYYQKVVADHYFDINADDALFRMAVIQEEKLKDLTTAAELYKQMILDFPGSLYVVEARKRLRNIRGDSPDSIPSRITNEPIIEP